MTMSRRTQEGGLVLGSFDNHRDAEAAVRRLVDAGFGTDDISIIAKDEGRAQQVADNTGTDVGKGAGIGALTGGVLGGLGGLLVGATALTIPGIGIVLAGPLAAILGGAGIGALGGGLAGALAAAGASKDEAEYYEGRLEAGDIVVAVAAGTREAEARRILSGERPGEYREVREERVVEREGRVVEPIGEREELVFRPEDTDRTDDIHRRGRG